jgi:HEPN domain-containing protein
MIDDNYKIAYDFRLRDARVLQEAKRCEGAMYLGGYAVECVLKYAYDTLLKSRCGHGHDIVRIYRDIIKHGAKGDHSLKYVVDLRDLPVDWIEKSIVRHWKPSLRYQGKLGTPFIQPRISKEDYSIEIEKCCEKFITEVEKICFDIRHIVEEEERRSRQ